MSVSCHTGVSWPIGSSWRQKARTGVSGGPDKAPSPRYTPRRAKPTAGADSVLAHGGSGIRTHGASVSAPEGPPLGVRCVRRAEALRQRGGGCPEAEVAARVLAPLLSAGRRRGPAAAASRRYERGRAGVCHAAGPRSAWGARHRHAPRPRVLRGGGAGERRGGGRRAERSGPRLR